MGNGSTTMKAAPVTVPLAGVTQVATSGAGTLAIAGPSHTVYAACSFTRTPAPSGWSISSKMSRARAQVRRAASALPALS